MTSGIPFEAKVGVGDRPRHDPLDPKAHDTYETPRVVRLGTFREMTRLSTSPVAFFLVQGLDDSDGPPPGTR